MSNKLDGFVSSQESKVTGGLFWSVGMRWSSKIISVLSIIILARLLAPEDYGLVALSLVVIGLVQIFFEFGVEMSILRSDKATTNMFDTAWTLRLIQSSCVALILPLLAPVAADFYQDERVSDVFYMCAVGIFVKGFENIGVIKFRKELDFKKDYYFNVTARLLGAIVTVVLAFYFKSYRALVLGAVFQHFISVVLSYVVIDYRPKVTLSEFRGIWSVSKWMLVKNFSDYIGRSSDYLIIGKYVPIAELGHYRWAHELASLASQELLQPISRVLLPAFSKIQSDTKRLYAAYLKSLNYIVSIAVPMVLGLGGVANEFVPFLLGGGDKWVAVIPLLEVAVFIGFFRVLHSLCNNLLIVREEIRLTAYVDVAKSLLILSMVFPVFHFFGLVGVFYMKVAASFFTMSSLYYFVIKCTDVSGCQIFLSVWRPCFSGLLMYFVLINISLTFEMLALCLLVKIFIGVLFYVIILLNLWWFSGRPEGFEKNVVDNIVLVVRRGGGA